MLLGLPTVPQFILVDINVREVTHAHTHLNKMADIEPSAEGSCVLLFPQIVKTIFQFLPATSICNVARCVRVFLSISDQNVCNSVMCACVAVRVCSTSSSLDQLLV